MTFESGQRLGPYEIREKLGEGGMGAVYRASDPRLGRDVAIKVLPAAFADDPERRVRFEREAKVLAALNHPNIAQLYGVEASDDGRLALVMELVDGNTLAERLSAGALPAEEALALALELAEALADAHDRGIVHRDLKPQNIKITEAGTVKVLDFGLAKALDPHAAGSGTIPSVVAASPTLMNSPTLAGGATELGLVLGTAAYMSPEQARGRTVDKRADIWAFGCVLWEMLTGARLFEGETASDMLAAVLRQDVPWERLPTETGAGARRLLRRCLERDPRRRLRDLGEARHLLEEESARDSAPASASRRSSVVGRWLPWLVAALASAVAVALALREAPRTEGTAAARTRFLEIGLPPGVDLDTETNAGQTPVLAISPDGSRIALVGETGSGEKLYLRDLQRPEVTEVPGSEGAASPFFSPDGRWVAFFSNGKLRKVAVGGGEPIALADSGLDRGGVWTPDGSIVFSPGPASPLMRIAAVGGGVTPLTEIDTQAGERSHRWPALLPGGKEIAFTVGKIEYTTTYDDAAIDAVDLATGRRRTLLRGASQVKATPIGALVVARGTDLFALPLTKAKGQIPEDLAPVLRGVGGDPASGVAYFDLASDGTLVYAAADPGERQFRLSWLAEDGTYTDLDLPEREYRLPRLSPDGRMLVVGIGRGSGSTSDLWLHRLGTAGLERFTFDEHSTTPLWSRDSRWIVFESNTGRQTFARKPIDGSSEPHELLAFDDHHSRGPLSYAPDGTLLYSDDFGAAFANELLILRPGESAGVKVVSSPAVEIAGQFSPDGRFLAYAQNVSGEAQIFVQAYPGPGGRWQVAQEATGPFRWSTDGRQIFYVSGRGLMAVAVDTREGFSIGAPRRLADVAFLHSADVFSNFDVAADGRFLVVRRAGGAPELGRIRVALNWFATIREALAGP